MAGTSIIDMLPEVVKEGSQGRAKRILDGLSNSSRISLQTNELGLSKFRAGSVSN